MKIDIVEPEIESKVYYLHGSFIAAKPSESWQP